MKFRNRSFYYKTIWLMLYVLPLSMSLIFRLLIFSIAVTLVFHLYYGIQWSYMSDMLPERPPSGIILFLVLVRHLGR